MKTAANEITSEAEADRLERANKMAADAGTNWADGFRPGTSGCHELLDRTQLMADMLERHLLEHPACVAEAEWYALAERAASALRELYQRVGAEHLAADEP